MTNRNMILTGLFAALLAVSSQIYFPLPFSPVPHTLQILFVFLAGILLGGRWGLTSVAIWIMLGVFGLPVFAQSKSGIINLFYPTGGFLIGFMVCAYLVGRLTSRSELKVANVTAIMFLGLAITYVIGLAGFMLSFQFVLQKPMTWEQAIMLTVVPFAPFDALKALAAAFLGVRVRQALVRTGLVVNR